MAGGVQRLRDSFAPRTAVFAAVLLGVASLVLQNTPVARAADRLCTERLITMSDGVRLHAWVSRLAPDARRPVLFMMDSYSRSGQADSNTGPSNNSCPLALPDDYVPQWLSTDITNRFTLVQVADRGTGLSEGLFDLNGPRIQQDVGESIDWAARQPWSNGRVVLTGESGTGFFTYYGMLNPHVKAALVFTSCPDMYRCFYRGGQYNSLAEVYLGATDADWAQLLQTRMQEGTGSDPNPLLQEAAFAQLEATTKTDALEDVWWQQRSALAGLPKVKIPVLYTTDLYDIVQPYDALELTPGARLVLGMGHQSAHRTIAARDRYEQLVRTPVDRFLAHYGLGDENGAQRDPRVTLVTNTGSVAQFQSDQLLVRGAGAWPLPDTQWTQVYLGAGKAGSAQSLNDGTLSPLAPQPGAASDAAPLLSGPHEDLRTQLFAGVEQADLRHEENAGLTYTTAPFKHDLEVTGPIALKLFATATTSDFDWAVRIADVWPDGESQWITDGYLRADLRQINPALSLRDADGEIVRPWLTYSTPQPVPLAQPVEYLVDVIDTSNVFRAGHRLRLDVLPVAEGGLDSPRTGGAGAVEVLRDPAHPSSLMLPVIGSQCQSGEPMVAATPAVSCAASYAQALGEP
jgi:hypothetical protein